MAHDGLDRLGVLAGHREPRAIVGLCDSDDAITYVKHDLDVIDSLTSIEFTERVRREIMNPKCEDYIEGRFRKTPIFIGDRPYVIGQMLDTT